MLAFLREETRAPMPAMTIYPYLLGGTCWGFDDESTGLKEEPFVFGMSEMIGRLLQSKSFPNASMGFALHFAAEPFDHDVELNWLSHHDVAEEYNCSSSLIPSGNWYRGIVTGKEMVGWLCPALFLYFEQAPKKIFAKVEPLPAGVDPIWHVKPGDSRARRFVTPPSE
jgi:hypothetical protein